MGIFAGSKVRQLSRQSWSLGRLRLYSIHASHASNRRPEPLRILFCGSDAFSIASLKALVELKAKQLSPIASIDVLCRTDKLAGRQAKTLTPVPIKGVANELGLPLHQLDSFESWKDGQTGNAVNLIVAVSFGLLIPEKVITSAEYGGLNVHPSLLPDFRGAAPIQHTLLQKRKHTGVSVQTLHPTKFDHGQILAQTPLPGIPVLENQTSSDLTDMLATEGAKLLSHVVEEGLYIPPLETIEHDTQAIDKITEGKGLSKATKLTKEDSKIDWYKMTSEEIMLRWRVFGRIWDEQFYKNVGGNKPTRIIYEDALSRSETLDIFTPSRSREPFVPYDPKDDTPRIQIPCHDGYSITFSHCTIAGYTSQAKNASMRKLAGMVEKLNGENDKREIAERQMEEN